MSFLALLLICISQIGQGIKSTSNPTEYMGCYNIVGFPQEKTRLPTNNSRINCKMFCKSKSYRYAGTYNAVLCWCRNSLSTSTVQDEECDIPCPMNNNETCGGKQAVQVYDTWPCRNEAWCNGSKCVDIDGIEYKCKCEPGWTGENCTETTTEPPSTRTTIFTTISPIINISSTIVGQDTESKTTFGQTSTSDINSEVATQKDKKWLTIGFPSAAGVFIINSILLTVWCIRKRTTNEGTESDSSDKSTVHTISHSQSCLQLEKIHASREEIMNARTDEDNVYDCIDDAVLYETIDT